MYLTSAAPWQRHAFASRLREDCHRVSEIRWVFRGENCFLPRAASLQQRLVKTGGRLVRHSRYD
jgi:hypothetical protein